MADAGHTKEEHYKKKLSFNAKSKMIKKPSKTVNSLSIALKSKVVEKTKAKSIPKRAALFDSSDSEPEEMPLEARMRMRNIGRNTPTSSGPNSFNKSKLGFVDSQKHWQKQQESILNHIQKKDDKPKPTLPQ